ncbi:MAG: sulfatase-like hydrolase/transferase [Phycisphaerales bacterium]|nr:sulfatase-like hydrolase/transferase [Phycisphaerales bacterium]
MIKHQLNRRNFLKSAAAFGVAAGLPLTTSAAKAKTPAKPNMILIMADDLGYECIGANGGTSYKTPVLDKMAETGVRFENCHSQPLCTPSRVKIMTGIYNVRNYVRFGVLDRKQTTFAHILKKSGYATCIVGKWQLGAQVDSAQHFGFDESCLWHHMRRTSRYPNPGLEINGKPADFKDKYGPDVVSDFACDFMERNKAKPFVVYYPMILTHCPFEPTPDSADWDSKSKGSKTYKGDAKYFGDMVTYMDKIIGKLLKKLDDLGLRDNTMVLFVGDNGTDKPVVSMMDGRKVVGRKGSMTDGGTRAPFIASWPGVFPKGKVCDDLVDFSDFTPTLCEAAGVAVPAELNIDGRSVLPQLKGQKGNPREWIYCWYSRQGASAGTKEWARNQRYKLYRKGGFFDISKDVLEKKPLKIDSLSGDARKVYDMLQKALDKYKDARPAALGGGGQRAKKKAKKKA